MKELFVLVTYPPIKVLRLGGARSFVAKSLLLKYQLLTLKRARKRAPHRIDHLWLGSACILSSARTPDCDRPEGHRHS